MDRLAELGLTTFQLGNAAGGGRALAERRAGSYLKSVRRTGGRHHVFHDQERARGRGGGVIKGWCLLPAAAAV